MANTTVRSDLVPPTHARNLAATTAAVLHLDVTNGGIAPPGINHLPCGLIANGTEGTIIASLVWKDATGTTITTNIRAGVFYPIAPMEITSANANALTIFWHPEP